ncbi:hypothetical protein OUZ56_003537 [Daphnia magna]|uniref:Uncharacterized protein n=1 Tax=Daphnia magna TaxID=35525 RepID=A0ABR0A909_9CRUS|nr:hypothetical protein OUZ56_003537 [Daphnia magna]
MIDSNWIKKSLATNDSTFTIRAQQAVLNDFRKEIEDLHKRYVAAAELDYEANELEKKGLEEVEQKFVQCQSMIAAYMTKEDIIPEPDAEDSKVEEARKKKLAFQHELETSQVIHDRMVEDLKRQLAREQEDIKRKIDFEESLLVDLESPFKKFNPLRNEMKSTESHPRTYQESK